VRRRLIHFGATFIFTLCIWGHVSEVFDHWDNTFQTGNDIEYSTVIVALIAGAALGLTQVVAIVLCTVSAMFWMLSSFVAFHPSPPTPFIPTGYSPPQPLRI
jgi:hypothetical protein